MSYDNKEIVNTLDKLSVKMRSNVFDERDRVNGKLTRWKTGQRFVFIDPPSKLLPKTVQIGAFRATIYHRGQTTSLECSRCLDKTHRASECTNDVRCRVCYELGHVSGSHVCSLAPREQLAAPVPPSPPSPTPPTLSAVEGEKRDENRAVPVAPTATKQTKLNFPAPSPTVARRKSRSATPTNREKRGRSHSNQRSPQQQAKKTTRETTNDHEPHSEREEAADSSSGT